MSFIIRIAFVMLCACAGTVVGDNQFSDPRDLFLTSNEINNYYEKARTAN